MRGRLALSLLVVCAQTAAPVDGRAQPPTGSAEEASPAPPPVHPVDHDAEEGFSALAVVDARSAPETASSQHVTAEEFQAAPRRSAEDALRQVPGLTLVQHGSEGKGFQFFLRGFDAIHGADLEITLEGIPLNEWSNVHAQGYLDLGLILPEFVLGVDVTKGPFTLAQGAFGMAGSADYQLGVGETLRGTRVAYTVGSTNRHRLFAGYSSPDGDGGEFVGLSATHDEGFGQNRRLQQVAFNGRVRLLDEDERGRLELSVLGHYSDFDLPGTLRSDDIRAGRVGFYDTYDRASQGRSARALMALHYQLRRSGHRLTLVTHGSLRRLDLRENFTGFLLDPLNGDRRVQEQTSWTAGLRADHELRLSDLFTLVTGAGVRAEHLTQREQRVGQDLAPTSTRRDLDLLQLIAHALVGVRLGIGATLRLDMGARVDLVHVDPTDVLDPAADRRGNLAALSPRVTLRYQPRSTLSLFGAYGSGLRPPEGRAFTSFDPGREGLSDELLDGRPRITRSDSGELGVRVAPLESLDVTLSGFATRIARESIFDHVSGVNLELNGTRRVGAELVLRARPVSWLALSADLTMTDARFIESGRRVPFAPWMVAGLRALVNHPSGVRAGFRTLAVAPRPLPHGARGATLVMVDATIGYTWRWLRIDLELENLLNRRLREGEFHFASDPVAGPPRSELPVLQTIAGSPFNARLTLGITL
jgi:iron complex outermembrane receptor protein